VSYKYFVILNPAAGKGKAQKEQPQVEAFFRDSGLTYEIVNTKGPGDALSIARNLPWDEGTAVISAGGDGTCNEVVNGLLSRPPAAGKAAPLIGLLPLGRGNDFSYSAGIPGGLPGAMKTLVSGTVIPLDAGRITGGYYPQGRYFINGVGIGFDTIVGLEAAKLTHVQDAFAYIIGALKTLIRFDPSPVLEIRFEDQMITLDAILVSLMNGKRMGGTFFMAPEALINDGQLDAFIVERANRRKILRAILRVAKGTQAGFPGVSMPRARSFSLKALSGGMVCHADGETICLDGKELFVESLPQVLRLLVPGAAE
jgi:YegS/Rv2252/BmrU family lipid kinase